MLNQVEQIKDRLDIAEVVGSYVKLQKAGHNYKALCPFHSEKAPSFSVSPDRQMWYCFGCNEGGDIFTFVEKIEGVEFADALRLLAERAGVKLKAEDPQLSSKRKELYEIVALAVKFFAKQLESPVGKKVIEYLKERGLKEEIIKDWQVGYAPDDWRTLYEFLQKKGYSDKTVELAGLTVKSEKGRQPYHDRFRHRIMFPIFDVQGQTIGFSGRVFDKIKGKTVQEDAGKYINTPNTLIYDKSRALYGLDRAKLALKEKNECLVVEGQLDVLLAHQAGSKNTVAVSGTALGEDHLKIIKRYTPNLGLCFDPDEAGEKATHRGAELALAAGFGVWVGELPAGKDAADLIKEDVSQWQEVLKNKVSFVKFLINRSLERFSIKDIEAKKAIVKNVLPAIKKIPSPIEREYWLGELSVSAGVSEKALLAELGNIKIERQLSSAPSQAKEKAVPKEKDTNKLEEYLLALLVRYPEGKEHLLGELSFIKSKNIKKILNSFIKEEEGIEKLLQADQAFIPVLAQAEFLEDIIKDEETELVSVLCHLKQKDIKEKLRDVTIKLKKAEQEKDQDEVGKLLTKFSSLSKDLLTYEK